MSGRSRVRTCDLSLVRRVRWVAGCRPVWPGAALTCPDIRWTSLTVAWRRPVLALGLALWIGPRDHNNKPLESLRFITPYLDQRGSAALRRSALRAALWLKAPLARVRQLVPGCVLTSSALSGTLSWRLRRCPSRSDYPAPGRRAQAACGVAGDRLAEPGHDDHSLGDWRLREGLEDYSR